jgi:hypothetical protein
MGTIYINHNFKIIIIIHIYILNVFFHITIDKYKINIILNYFANIELYFDLLLKLLTLIYIMIYNNCIIKNHPI